MPARVGRVRIAVAMRTYVRIALGFVSWQYFNAPWKDLERILSDRHAPLPASPATAAPSPPRRQGSVPYAELHCHSNFSFLDGASHPEELVDEAARLGLEALAFTDHNGFYGIVRFAEAARALGLRTVFGAELTLSASNGSASNGSASNGSASNGSANKGSASKGKGSSSSRVGPADPKGRHLLVLARDPQGYALLARAISEGQLAGSKNAHESTMNAWSNSEGPAPATIGSCSAAAARARCPQRWSTRARPRRPQSLSGWSPISVVRMWLWSCGTTACRSIRFATTGSLHWPCRIVSG